MSPRKTLLFVDDEPNVLEAFVRMLHPERHVWELRTVGSATEALDILASAQLDAIISDYHMPGQNGFALLQAVRSSDQPDVPFVIVTGSSEAGLKRTALELGATDLLSKPVEREDLLARLRNVIRLKECQDAIKSHNAHLEDLVEERTAELAASRHEIIWRLAKAGESRDEDTGNHVVRVALYCKIIAEKLQMEPKFVRLLFLSSPLHDIGKIGIPDSLLLKPGKLTDEEWSIMRTHCRIGTEILDQDAKMVAAVNKWAPESLANIRSRAENPILDMASRIALCHHEKWDGSGYPEGLAREDIPIEARIVAIADVYDALCSPRPYKAAMAEDKALEIIRSGEGKHFDPAVLAAFEEGLPDIREIRLQLADEIEPEAKVA